MNIRPTQSGGRTIAGDTPWGKFRFEVDPQGELVDYHCEVRTPDNATTTVKRRPCSGCGGAKYDPQAYNAPGGADQLIQQMG